MNIRDFEYFNCLCSTKSFTKAAEKLYISQPSVTLSLSRLERELDSKLIIRDHSNKEIQITESGEILRKRIKNILREIEEAKLEIRKVKNKKIKFGIPPIIGAYFFPKFIEELISKSFIENIEFVQAGSVKMKELLLDGKIDIALIGSLEPIRDKKIESYLLKKESFVICISKNNKLLREKSLNFEKLKNEQFIVLSDEYLHLGVLKKLLNKYNIESQKIYYTDEIQTAKSLIAANLGVGIMTKMSVEDLVGIQRKPLKDDIKFHVSIVTKKEHYLTDVEKSILDLIKEKNKEINSCI
ncbi:LysR family transcriptional regulator [Clostridium perfringens]|uniref:LysR family transcriptional regulator n=3 Tax=Clostridium perfringens TaxID=1502 RepID=UPI0039E892CD